MITFFKSVIKELRAKVEAATGNPIGPYRMGLDTNTTITYYRAGTTTLAIGSTTTVLQAPGHVAQVGDVLHFDGGALDKQHAFVQSTTSSTITLSQAMSAAPASGDFLYILRPSFVESTLNHAIFTSINAIGGTNQTAGFDFGTFLQPDFLVQTQTGVLPTGIWSGSNSQFIAWDGSVNSVSVPPTGPLDGRKIVTTAGTRVALATTTACRKVDIVAETDNTGTIVVGGVSCIAALATRRGYPLAAGDSYFMEASDLANIYIDSTVSGDGITFVYYT